MSKRQDFIVLMLLSAHTKRVGVSRMQDLIYMLLYKKKKKYIFGPEPLYLDIQFIVQLPPCRRTCHAAASRNCFSKSQLKGICQETHLRATERSETL